MNCPSTTHYEGCQCHEHRRNQRIAELEQRITDATHALHRIGLSPQHHQTLEKAVAGATEIATGLRQQLADPPADVQEAVMDKLGLRNAHQIVEAAKQLKQAKGRHNTQIASQRLFDLLP